MVRVMFVVVRGAGGGDGDAAAVGMATETSRAMATKPLLMSNDGSAESGAGSVTAATKSNKHKI